MVSLDVKCCLRNPIISKTIDVDETSSASDLRALVSVCFEIEPYSFDMVHLGSSIKEDQVLSDLDLRSNPVVHILNSPRNFIPQKVSFDMAAFNTAASSLKKILKDKGTAITVAKKLQDHKLLEYIIKAVPEFGSDPIAISIITSKDLMKSFLNKSGAAKEKILSQHPSMAGVVMFLVEALKNENLDKTPDKAQVTTNAYNIDYLSDDDDDDEADDENPSGESGTRRGQPRDPANGQILFSQRGRPHSSTNNTAPSTSTQQPAAITADFFQQAMRMVTGGSNSVQLIPANPQPQITTVTAPPPPPTQHSAVSEDDLAAKIQQIVEMGLANESLAREILLQFDGNLEAAINLLLVNY